MVSRIAHVAAALLLLAQGCAAGTSGGLPENPVDGGAESGTPTKPPDASEAAEAGESNEVFTVTLDKKLVGATLRSCGYEEDSTYRSLTIVADLAEGSTLSINYLYGYAGGSAHAPTGQLPDSERRLVTIELAGPGDDKSSLDKFPRNGSGSLDLIATGGDGLYAGAAEGSFVSGNPLDPRPSILYTLSWRHHGAP